MATVTISRQLGSLGNEVARLAAECLGYRLVGRDLINQAARQAGAPEVALASIDELGLLGLRPSKKATADYLQAVHQVMKELAIEGNIVIVGRGGQVILKDWPDSLHVRIIAPAALRAERIANQQHIPLPGAQAQVEASDRYHYNYLKRCYQVRWDDPELYDLILNTRHSTPEQAAAMICQRLAQCA
jgi:CMP/dCMP kinase